jgi:hypothetical protein
MAAIVLAAAAFPAPAQEKSDTLAQGFQSPPESAKPRTWWPWVSGNVSSAGITADLEAMKRIGLGGAQFFFVDQSDVIGPVKFMSPEWRQMVHHALMEGDRLHLEMGMEDNAGWSESGGPWIKPQQAMQQVVWSESRVAGGQKITLSPPQPMTIQGYYNDIALLAFPSQSGDDVPDPVQVTASSPGFDGAKVIAHDLNTPALLKVKPPGPFWIQLAYAQPITCRSLVFQVENPVWFLPGELQASDDGVTFKNVANINLGECASFAPTTAKYFRLIFRKSTGDLAIRRISLEGARIDSWPQRTGLEVAYPGQDVAFKDMTLKPDEIVDPATVVDLTGKTEWDAPAGNWTLVRIGHTGTGMLTHPSHLNALECDKMSRAAVEFQFQNMFGPVLRDSSSVVGGSFRNVMLDSWEAGFANWTPLMRDDFKKRRGYDLWPWLLTLTGRVVQSADATERFLWDYRRTVADLVADNQYGTVQNLSHQRQMDFYAEAVGINMPTIADQLQCKGRTDVPMGEFWVRDHFDNVDDPREAASAAHIYGQNIAATESFTTQPDRGAWTNDPYSLKALGDMEFCNGVNRFFFSRYAQQPWLDRQPGMSMGAYGINFERTNTWWNEATAWMNYLARCEYLLQRGSFSADLLYFYGEGAPACIRHKELTPDVPTGYDYDVCDAEILLIQMSVENGEIVLKSGMHYRVLVLPALDRMTLPVLQKVQTLVQAGATVYGPKPRQSPSLAGYPESDKTVKSIADEVWGNCDGTTVTDHAYGQGKIVWGEPLKKALAVVPDFAASQPDMLDIHRQDEGSEIYFVSN